MADSLKNRYDRIGLLREVRERFPLDWQGIHGVPHWGRVRVHGRTVGRMVGANLLVVELFSFLHDSCRDDDGFDQDHGKRAAQWAQSLQGRYFDLAESELRQLAHAIRHHSDGGIHADVTIQTCWDADRLDLGRVGIRPHPKFLSPEAALLIPLARRWSGG
jgi:uncharacterized protein